MKKKLIMIAVTCLAVALAFVTVLLFNKVSNKDQNGAQKEILVNNSSLEQVIYKQDSSISGRLSDVSDFEITSVDSDSKYYTKYKDAIESSKKELEDAGYEVGDMWMIDVKFYDDNHKVVEKSNELLDVYFRSDKIPELNNFKTKQYNAVCLEDTESYAMLNYFIDGDTVSAYVETQMSSPILFIEYKEASNE